jgi:hypothetical protein
MALSHISEGDVLGPVAVWCTSIGVCCEAGVDEWVKEHLHRGRREEDEMESFGRVNK